MTEFGDELARLMSLRCIGVRKLAGQVPCNPGHVSNLRNGRGNPSSQMAARLDELLDAGGALSRLIKLPNSKTSFTTACNDPADSDLADDAETIEAPCRLPDGRITFLTVPRRRFLLGMGVAAAGIPATVAPRFPDAGNPAERLLRARQLLRDIDNLSGPRDVIPVATRQITAIQQLWRTHEGADAAAYLTALIQYADLLAWFHQDCASYRPARQWLDRALEWAHISGDQTSIAFILARKGQLAGDMLNPAEAVAVAEASIRLAGPRSRIGAVAATYASHGYGLAGNRGACDRLCGTARDALDDAGGTGLPWAKFFDGPYIDVHHARSLAALGEYRAAAERFRAAIDDLHPDYHRDRGVYLAREAAAYAGAGEADHAAGIGLQALAIGTETRSGRIFNELATVESRLARTAASPAVREFTDAMNTVVLSTAATKGTP